MAEDKIDKAIIDFFAALKELGELRRRYDSLIGNVKLNVYNIITHRFVSRDQSNFSSRVQYKRPIRERLFSCLHTPADFWGVID